MACGFVALTTPFGRLAPVVAPIYTSPIHVDLEMDLTLYHLQRKDQAGLRLTLWKRLDGPCASVKTEDVYVVAQLCALQLRPPHQSVKHATGCAAALEAWPLTWVQAKPTRGKHTVQRPV